MVSSNGTTSIERRVRGANHVLDIFSITHMQGHMNVLMATKIPNALSSFETTSITIVQDPQSLKASPLLVHQTRITRKTLLINLTWKHTSLLRL